MAGYQSVPIFWGKKVEFLKFLSFLNCEYPKHLSKAKNQSEFGVFEKFTSAYLFQIGQENLCDYLLLIYMKKFRDG